MPHIHNITSHDPDHFQEIMQPASGAITVQPGRGTMFNANIHIAGSHRLTTFTINATSARVLPDADQFFGLAIPIGLPVSIHDGSRYQTFDNSNAHFLHHGKSFDFTSRSNFKVLCTNIHAGELLTYANKLNRVDPDKPAKFASKISFMSSEGSALLRSLAGYWSVLRHRETGNNTNMH